MAKTIPQLSEATTFDENAVFPFDTGTETFKISGDNLSQAIRNLTSDPTALTANGTFSKLDRFGVVKLNSTGGSFNLNLPNPALFSGAYVDVLDVGGALLTFPVTFVRFAAEQIQGVAADFVAEANYGSWRLFSNGTNWFFI